MLLQGGYNEAVASIKYTTYARRIFAPVNSLASRKKRRVLIENRNIKVNHYLDQFDAADLTREIAPRDSPAR
jgi:hypothetical protein